MSVAFTFPGQGSQQVGMGHALAEQFTAARTVFDEIDEALGIKLSTIMWEGPDDRLMLTENAQPALMAVSLAAVAVLGAEFGIGVGRTARFVAGHSLGEYSALAAAGSFTLSDAARLLQTRGRAMQRATPVGTGAMAALLGLDYEAAVAIAEEAAEDQVCQAANDNAPGQVVVSGDARAVERAVAIARSRGAKRAVLLPVSAPFHCALMQPAADIMAEALSTVTLKRPSVPVIANVTAGPLSEPSAIRQALVAQVTGVVRWRESIGYLGSQGVSLLVELGAGRVLTGLSKRMVPEAKCIAASMPDEIAQAAELLRV
jgi:[acyl-carrier-protein] S-malonyltransferase